jgi:hypothetical protein
MEENDDFSMAWGIGPGFYPNLKIQGSDEDWFRLYLNPGDMIFVDIYSNHLEGDLQLELYDPFSIHRVGSYDITGHEFVSISADFSGDWRIRVYHEFGNTNVTYDLDIWITTGGPGDDWAEENDHFGEAKWLDPNYYSGLKLVGFDEDWFQLYLIAGDKIDVTIFFNHWDGDLELELWDPSNVYRIGSYSSDHDEYISFTADMSGDWRIRVYHASGDTDVYYDLDIWINNGMHGGDDAYEFNNNPYDILHLNSGVTDPTGGNDEMDKKIHPSNLAEYERTWLSDLYGVAVQGDEDWYAIEVTPGFLNLEVKLSFNHSLGDIDMDIHVLDFQGNVNPIGVGSYSTNNSEYINATVPRGGIYFIRVFYGNNGNEYNLWWDDHKTRFWDDAFEFNDIPGSAYDISAFENDPSGIRQIDLGVQYNNDFYFLEIHEGFERLRVLIVYDFAEGVMGLEIYDHEMTKITGNFTMSDNEYIDYVVPSNGTYYIRVFGDDTGNTYNLFWEAWENEEIGLIPGYDLLILFGAIIGVSIIVIKKKRSKFRQE